jgi:GTPase involved in cell partitioning and DNA repair
LADYHVLASELAAYNEELTGRTRLIVLNKMDCLYEEEQEAVKTLFADNGMADALLISALDEIGIDALKKRIGSLLEAQREAEEEAQS